MTLLLDTCVFLWWITDSELLSATARKTIETSNSTIFLSTASIWEMVIKTKLGKLELPKNPQLFISEQLEKNQIQPLSITYQHALKLYELAPLHQDPFDRILIAQALHEQYTLVTPDSHIQKYKVPWIW